ncbi:MAG: hypothetical protein ACXACX_10965 [Candidatus Hodarchaeales archaeon]|jgi:sugar/nucleoside kinase (ribokinase family)
MSKLLAYNFKTLTKQNVTILPDFFLDVIVDPNYTYEEFINVSKKTYNRGGGNILGPSIDFLPGGNAGNVVLTTNILDMKTYFLGETSELGLEMINFFYKKKGVIPFFNTTGELSSSFILEFRKGNNKVNIMASSSKSIRNFGPKKLSKEQEKIIRSSNFIAITNFQNSKLLKLIKHIFDITGHSQVISIDFSDLTPHIHRVNEIYQLFKEYRNRYFIISGNETEISILGNNLTDEIEKPQDLDVLMKNLSENFPNIFFCLHTATYSQIAFNSNVITKVESKSLSLIKRITGAGDSWHGGLIKGISLINKSTLLSITDDEWFEILLFANIVAGYWVFNGEPGSLDELRDWINISN